MIDFLKRLFGGAPITRSEMASRLPAKPPLPDAELDAFRAWYLAQTRPAVALVPDKSGTITASGSRLGGPAWLAAGETWPSDVHGVPLEFIAQLDCADCRSLTGYPENGVIQFFVARDDLYGCNFDDPAGSNFLVRRCDVTQSGALTPPPPLEVIGGQYASDYSPFQDDAARAAGIALRAVPIVDRIDQSIMEAEKRVMALYDAYDTTTLDAFLESHEAERPPRHHTGGYPAYTQSDVHYQPAFADYDHVLLRLTSDDTIMWGDVGECVFLIRSDDLKRGDLSRVAYSWDCY